MFSTVLFRFLGVASIILFFYGLILRFNVPISKRGFLSPHNISVLNILVIFGDPNKLPHDFLWSRSSVWEPQTETKRPLPALSYWSNIVLLKFFVATRASIQLRRIGLALNRMKIDQFNNTAKFLRLSSATSSQQQTSRPCPSISRSLLSSFEKQDSELLNLYNWIPVQTLTDKLFSELESWSIRTTEVIICMYNEGRQEQHNNTLLFSLLCVGWWGAGSQQSEAEHTARSLSSKLPFRRMLQGQNNLVLNHFNNPVVFQL